MSQSRTIWAATLACLVLAACDRAPAPVPATETPAPEPAMTEPATTPSAVISEIDHNSPASAAPGFDVKTFAGTYAGTLPCADCPGIDASLAFTSDGQYTETLVYRERDTRHASKGSWTVDADGRRIRLDPASKDEADMWVEVVSPTEIRKLDGAGQPIDAPFDLSLHRR